MCISCPEPPIQPRHSIPRCKIRQKIREISHFPQFIMVSALKLLIINLEGTKRSVYLRESPKMMEEPRIEIVR